MKHCYTLFLILCCTALYAQAPANDDCVGLIDLGTGVNCSDIDIYSNVDATASDIGFEDSPFCSPDNTAPRDVWFSFTVPADLLDYTITVTGTEGEDGEAAMTNPQIAVYRGACQTDGLSLTACASEVMGDTLVEVDLLGLTPAQTYYLRISDHADTGESNAGSFRVCIEEFVPVFTVDEDSTNLCEGFLYDSGGPDGDYGSDENNTFTICPTIPPACINFTLEYFNLEYDGGDVLNIYDGASPAAGTILASFSGGDTGSLNEDSNSGGVCFQTQASSGCLTVQFISDETVSFEGFSASWSCSFAPCDAPDPIDINDEVSIADITNTLSSPASVVTITDLNCADGAYGLFQNGDDTDLGIDKGIVLTTGSANLAVGPNTSGSSGLNNGFPGDNDLDSLSFLIVKDSSLSNDACVLELDIFANTDELSFEYVFGSEEYREFINSNFNDIFTFLVSGPGIAGDPLLNNQQNIAILPNGQNTLVQINSVNDESNWQYFRNNENFATGSGGQSVEYDGLTSDSLGVKKSLTASIAVEPCQTYHLKLAIADRQDGIYDSGVFIGEIRGGAPDVVFESASGLDYVIEDCALAPDSIILRVTDIPTDTLDYQVVLGGTAVSGVDYILNIPGVITFGPNQTEYVFPFEVLSDMLIEGTETVTLQLLRDFGCGSVEVATLEIDLREEVDINIEIEGDTLLACALDTFTLVASGAQSYEWTPMDVAVDSTNQQSASFSLDAGQSQYIYVTGFIGNGCSGMDSVFVDVVDPMVSIDQDGPLFLCQGDSVTLSATTNFDINRPGASISWTPTFTLDNPDSSVVVADPNFTTLYRATVSIGGCSVSDTITVDVDVLRVPTVIEDATLCQNFSINLAENDIFTTADNIFMWEPTDGLDDPTIPNPLATPDQTTTYTLISTVANGACADTQSVTITVIPADIEIQEEDPVLLCAGDPLNLNAVTNTGLPVGVVWSSSNNLLNAENTLSVNLTPDRSGVYYATFTTGICTVVDSITAFVDSIPSNLTIMAEPMKQSYCEGELVVLTSETYDPVDFPRIDHQWNDGPGQQTGDTLYNMVLNVVDSFLYTRVTQSGGCIAEESIQINVIPLANLTVTPEFDTLCLGEMTTLTVMYDGEGSVEWEPDVGCSGPDCLEVEVSPVTSTTYTIMGENEGCPVETTATVTVIQPPNPNVPATLGACAGEPRRLALSQPEFQTTYLWTSPDDPNFMSTDLNVEVTLTEDATFNLVATNSCFEVERTVMVMVLPVADPSIVEDQMICSGESVTLSGMMPQELVNYSWTVNGEEVSTEYNFTVTPTTTTTYVLTAGNECGEVVLSTTITVVEEIILDVPESQQLCVGETVRLTMSSPQQGVVYSWTSPDDPTFMSDDIRLEVSPDVTTTYVLEASNSCFTEIRTVEVVVVNQPSISLPADLDICQGSDASITVEDDAPDNVVLSYQWFVNGTLQTDETGATLDLDNLSDTSQVDVIVTYGNNCGTVVATTFVNVFPTDFDFFIELDPDTTLFAGDPITLTAVADPMPNTTFTYEWMEGDVTLDENGMIITQVPTVNVNEGTVSISYGVTATYGPLGCVSTARTTVMVRVPSSAIPNVFTPNGDEENDRFRLFFEGNAEIISMQVISRWGQVVYEGTDLAGWDGTYNGEPAPSDVYIYSIQYRLGNVEFSEKGEVTLLR